jgi:hypothetical protein
MPPKRKAAVAAAAAINDKPEAGRNWENLTIPELKEECKKRRLLIGGTKKSLVERLEGDDAVTAAIPANAPPPDFSAMSHAQLRVECAAHRLSITGNKATLIARLQEAGASAILGAHEDAPIHKRARTIGGSDVAAPSRGEKRLRPFVDGPDADYNKKLKKIQKERLFMLDRQKSVDKDGYVCETFDIAGSTGNIYQTTIGRKPSCKCMDAVSLPLGFKLLLIIL